MAAIDPKLKIETLRIEKELFAASEKFEKDGDFRWFFSYAHAKITEQINKNLNLFRDPNAVIRLNAHFASEYLKAASGQPHEAWSKAFKICKALEKNAPNNPALVGEVELCGAQMANVHIHVDLANALREVGCIDRNDYGNILTFVLRGNLAAENKLRGKFGGATMFLLSALVGPKLNMDVKKWRNAAYTEVCAGTVPDPEKSFQSQIQY